MAWKKYKHKGTHFEFEIKGEKIHLIDDETFNGKMLDNYYQGDTDVRKRLEEQYSLKIQRLEERLKRALFTLRFYSAPLLSKQPYEFTDYHKKAVLAVQEIEEELKL